MKDSAPQDIRLKKLWRARIGIKIKSRPVGPLQANFYLVYDTVSGDAVVIDPGGDAGLIAGAASDEGVSVKAIFITHSHADHLAAAAELSAATGAPLYGSSEVGTMLSDPEKHQLFPGMPSVAPAGVERVLADGDSVAFSGFEVEAIATPGHSTGSLTYLIDGALFTGDLLFHGSVGRTDLPGGSFDELAASMKKLVRDYPADTAVFPGHGNATTLGEEKEHNIFLEDLDW